MISVWKRGSQSLFRREDGAPAFGPRAPWQGSSSVPFTGGMEARPHDEAIEERATVRDELRAARPPQTTMNGGGGLLDRRGFRRAQSTWTSSNRGPQGFSVEAGPVIRWCSLGADEHLSFAD